MQHRIVVWHHLGRLGGGTDVYELALFQSGLRNSGSVAETGLVSHCHLRTQTERYQPSSH